MKYKNCAECEEQIVKELEQKLISLTIQNYEATGNEFREMGGRVHKGKAYKVFIKVEEVQSAPRDQGVKHD